MKNLKNISFKENNLRVFVNGQKRHELKYEDITSVTFEHQRDPNWHRSFVLGLTLTATIIYILFSLTDFIIELVTTYQLIMTFLLFSGLVLLLSLAIFGLTSVRKVYFANINNNILIRLTGTPIHSWKELTDQLIDKGVEEAKMRMN